MYPTLKKYFGYDEFRPLQKEIVERVLAKNDVIGIDLVELCPDQDQGEITSSLMFHMLMSLLGYIDAK